MVVRYKYVNCKSFSGCTDKLNVVLLQLEDGDIICFQKSPQVGSTSQCEHPDVRSFLEYVHRHQVLNEPLQCDSTSLGTFMGHQV